MRIRLRLFAVCRDRVGTDHLELDVVSDPCTAADVLAAVQSVAPELADVMPAVRLAVNQRFAEPGDRVTGDDELALIPPVSGGSSGLFAVRTEKLDPREAERAVAHDGAGAVVTFQGTVRDRTDGHSVTHLDYEAYDGMAQRVLEEVAHAAEVRFEGVRVAVLHRTGRLAVGEVSVVISVSAPHRAAAFDATRYVIERLKADVPIWKKEARADGSVWVGVGS